MTRRRHAPKRKPDAAISEHEQRDPETGETMSLVAGMANAVRAPSASSELDFDDARGTARPYTPSAYYRTARALDLLLVPVELPAWMRDPSLLPKRPPTSRAS